MAAITREYGTVAGKGLVRLEVFLQIYVRLEGFSVIFILWQRAEGKKLNNKGAKTQRF
jgi:hypothetical protein